MNKVRFIIVPDVHGRTFWRKDVYDYLKNTDDVKIIFLGDYVDPYGYEGISREDAFCVFEEILELKMVYKDRIVLLIGNHDFHYFNGSIGGCRKDMVRANDLKFMYLDNMDLFEYYHVEEIGGTNYLFSHAGFLNSWVYRESHVLGIDEIFDYDDKGNVTQESIDKVNFDLIKTFDFKKLAENRECRLSMDTIGHSRGGLDVGSFMWADINDHLGVDETIKGCVQVVGHTQQENDPVNLGDVICLDCRECFYLFDDGIKRKIDNDYIEIPNRRSDIERERQLAWEKIKRYAGFFI